MSATQQFDDYDPRAWLERSALLFLNYDAFAASIECFKRLTTAAPGYSMSWYGLSTAVYAVSGTIGNLDLLQRSISLLKHCLSLDPTNPHANAFLKALPEQTPLTQTDIDSIAACSNIPSLPVEFEFYPTVFADVLKSIDSAGDRMQIIMWLGTFDDESATELLLAGLEDVDEGVVRASLKRLDANGSDRRIPKMLSTMHTAGKTQNYEPYFSMAAKRFKMPFAKEGNF